MAHAENQVGLKLQLKDHDYAVLANHEDVGAPNIQLKDHDYAVPANHEEIRPQQEENTPAPDEEPKVGPAIDEEHEAAPAHDEEQEAAPAHNEAQEVVINAEPRTYRKIPGIRLNSKFYVDNLGYKYYQKKLLLNKITLICERQRNPSRPMCHGSASISRNEIDNQISIVAPHNHEPEAINLDVPFLRNALGERAVDRTITTPSVRDLYNSEIIRHPQAAISYTFLQTQSRVKRMKQSRRPQLPQYIHKLSEMLREPRNANYTSTFQIPSTAFFNQELIVNGISVGIIF